MSGNNNNNNNGNGNDDEDLLKQISAGAMIQHDDGIPHGEIINFFNNNLHGSAGATFWWKAAGELEVWEGHVSYNEAQRNYVAMFKSKNTPNIQKYFNADISSLPSIPVVIPNKDATYFKIELDAIYSSRRAGTASISRPNNNNNSSNANNNNSNNNNNNSSSQQQNNNNNNNNGGSNNNNNSRPVPSVSSAPTNNNFRSNSNSNNNNDSDNDSDDGRDHAWDQRAGCTSDNIMVKTPPVEWAMVLQEYSDHEKEQINKEYRRLNWGLREGWHERPAERAHVECWNLHFEMLYINNLERGELRNKIIRAMQHTETAMLILCAQKDKRVFIDYKGMAQADVLASPNPNVRHFASFVTRRAPSAAAARASSASKGGKAKSKFAARPDVCFKCKAAGQTTAFSACKTHNKKLSGNDTAAPQH